MHETHVSGLETDESDWALQRQLMRFLESNWHEPDEGIWEVRGGRKQFTHSKMMAWVAFDRAVKLAERCAPGAAEDMARWKKIRDQIHREVCELGYNKTKKAFTQFYGSDALDASLLMMPRVGFLPPSDARVRGTIEAIARELMQDGLVMRYRVEEGHVDGLPGGEGTFLPCSFWLANGLHFIGRTEEAKELFERLLTLRNDLGLCSEEYDPIAKRQLGNFPQAFTHLALVNSARILGGHEKLPAETED
jgi:GH15 family glucan-1,4-alpha-glucosidase